LRKDVVEEKLVWFFERGDIFGKNNNGMRKAKVALGLMRPKGYKGGEPTKERI